MMSDPTHLETHRESVVPFQELPNVGDTTEISHPNDPVTMLKAAFPNMELEIIEEALRNRGDVEETFETLLAMSDPDYKPNAPEGNAAVPFEAVNIQLQRDEDLARQLSAEMNAQTKSNTQRNSQSSQRNIPEYMSKEYMSKELSVLKGRAIEAGTTTKKKVVDLYNNFMASRAPSSGSGASSSWSHSNSEHAAVLTNGMSELRLSENEKGSIGQEPEQRIMDDRAFAIRLLKEEAYYERVAAMQAKGPAAEDGNPVTFSAPGRETKEKDSPKASYVIGDEDDLGDLLEPEKANMLL